MNQKRIGFFVQVFKNKTLMIYQHRTPVEHLIYLIVIFNYFSTLYSDKSRRDLVYQFIVTSWEEGWTFSKMSNFLPNTVQMLLMVTFKIEWYMVLLYFHTRNNCTWICLTLSHNTMCSDLTCQLVLAMAERKMFLRVKLGWHSVIL